MNALRAKLRADTRTHHDDVETLFARSDITTRKGLADTLSSHAIALGRVVMAIGDAEADSRRDLLILQEAAESDLARIGSVMPHPVEHDDTADAPHPLGLVYVIAGSRFGARQLGRQIAEADDPVVRSAGRYFHAETAPGLWPGVYRRLQDWTGSDAEANKISEAANTGFAWFASAYRRVSRMSELNACQAPVA